MKSKKAAAFLSFFLFLPFVSQAYWVWSPESGKFVNPEGAVQDTAEEQYNYAMKLYKDKNLDEAKDQLRNLVKKYPSSKITPEAQYRLGTVYEEKGDYMKAFHAYKTLVETYPQSERLNEVIEREYRIGNLFLSGKKAKLMGLEILPSLPRAAEIFQHIVKQAPYSAWGDQAAFRLGLTYKKWAHYDEAVEAFQTLIDQYPKSDLLADARFQLAETAFLRSAASARDQRAIDDASKQVDRFLTRYPDSTASEKAAKLRQMIDEKNAEKNYRIGLYYEKENYLSSALIYYSDLASRYSHTEWGKKAVARLKSLKEPAKYLADQEKEAGEQIQLLEAKLKTLTDKDSEERNQIKRQLERAHGVEKSISKNKSQSLKRREADIKRREGELKASFKKLAQKKKQFKNNKSEDFQRAMDRWTASLQAEKDALEKEKAELKEWRQTLGMESHRFSLEMLPFIGESPSELDKVRRVEARKLYKLSDEKKVLLGEKEVLYKQFGELSAQAKDLEAKRLGLVDEGEMLSQIGDLGDEKLKRQQQELKATREEISRLEKSLNEKKSVYEKNFGASSWLGWTKIPAQAVTSSAGAITKSLDKSLDFLNPFDAATSSPEKKSLEELLALRMHMKEKIMAQQNVTETLARAFDEELALQEKKRLMRNLESETQVNAMELRKSIKKLEKQIRGGYEEIQDRHARKRKMLEDLDRLLHQRTQENLMTKTAYAAKWPAVFAYKFGRSFLFGMPHKDVELTKAAQQLPQDSTVTADAKKLEEEIELESLLIESKSREIVSLEKELEILKAKASLAGGYKFRSAFVTIPYVVVGEAIESANRLVPKKGRQEILANRLNKETTELETEKVKMAKIEALIKEKSKTAIAQRSENALVPAEPETAPEQAPAQPPQTAVAPENQEGVDKKDEVKVREEIQTLAKQLEVRESFYAREKAVFETQLRAMNREYGQTDKKNSRESARISKEEKSLQKALREVQDELRKLVVKEQKLEKEESSILEKRIQKIDLLVKKVNSKAMTQDLLTERDRMEQRIMEINSRHDFLTKEMERFELPETTGSHQ